MTEMRASSQPAGQPDNPGDRAYVDAMGRLTSKLGKGHPAASKLGELARETASLRTLEDVVGWALDRPDGDARNRGAIHDVVNQDEYTLDVIVTFEDVFVVFDTT